ncbi:MAG: aldolase/citrate lyase family protein [bacterium]|nr:aldolase/citrate lyase family protein [bacterium]
MVPNETKKKCLSGEITLGAGVRLARTADIGMAMKACGFDWLFIDTEHSTLDLDQASLISISALGQGISPIVRVPGLDGHSISRTLDGGAQGIVLPHVNSAEEARAFVEQGLFPPVGKRSSGGLPPQTQYEGARGPEMLEALNRETLLVAMIETPEAGDAAGAIAAIEGIDVLLIGTNDLCLGMGIPGKFEDAQVNRVYDQVISACKKHGKTPGMGGVYVPEIIGRRLAQGMKFILCGNDHGFMMSGGKAQTETIRSLQP